MTEGGGGGWRQVRMDVNEELKIFTVNVKKKKTFFFWGGGVQVRKGGGLGGSQLGCE